MDQPLIVQAEYSFKGGNNDELCFQKGDLITVTQREEGGWWEGTLNDKTGWFPSNYVIEYKAPLPPSETIRPPEEIQEYRSVVLKDLLDSEKAHVAEIQGLLENFLEPLQNTQILTNDEYAQLMCNFVEVVKTHDELLSSLEECNDRVGKLFLTKAPIMKSVHQAYCAAHPRAIVILDKHKDDLEKYMERQGAASPGLLVLTTGLSKPFRRLDKYSAMLQELERHMESSHPDRGDTQRSVAVYKDIAATCSATRRQKELELQVLTGPVRGWQGQELSTLGDIIHMGSVAVGADHRDRYFVLFPQTLLILSVSQRMSAFIYEGKLPLTNIVVNRLEDTETFKNAFEISGPLIERIVAVCQGPNEANRWVDLLNGANPTLPISIKRNTSNSSMNAPQPPSHSPPYVLDSRGYCARFSLCAYQIGSPNFRLTLPPKNYPPTAPYANLSAHFWQLVKQGMLRRSLVRVLLYPEARLSVDLEQITLRRKQMSTAFVSEDRSTLSRQDAFELPTDSESDGGSCGSDPFEFIKFYTRKVDSFGATDTFIDHGSLIEDSSKMPSKRHCSTLNLINLNSGSSTDISPGQKDSLIIGSKAVRALNRMSSDRSVINYTSSARLNLGKVRHLISENSETSSYDGRIGGTYVGCEDLANMDDEAEIKLNNPVAHQQVPSSPTERHSMPNLFVDNRFNRTDRTQICVPTYHVREGSLDRQDRRREEVVYDEDENSVATHSSSLDLPAVMPAPDSITAQLLYNMDGTLQPENQRLSLSREVSPFKKHSLNSDKKISGPSTSGKPPLGRSASMRRCISYQYVQMANPDAQRKSSPPQRTNTTSSGGKCKCCESSQCPSPRSSDSGMAGSCTISSPDHPLNNTDEYYPHPDERALSHSQSNGDLSRFDVCGMFRNKFLTQDDDDDDERGERDVQTKNPNARPPVQIHTKSIFIGRRPITETFPTNGSDNQDEVTEIDEDNQGMFRSGMYAHWWKKEKLPNAVIRGIVRAQRKEPSIDSAGSCSCCYGTRCCSRCQDFSATPTTASSSSSLSAAGCPICNSARSAFVAATTASASAAVEGGFGSSLGSDVTASQLGIRSFESANNTSNTSTVTTQTEPVLQSSSELQSISHSHSASTSSSTSTPSKSAKSSSGPRPQIKFSPDIEQYFQDDKYGRYGGGSRSSPGGKSSGNGAKRKDRKHKS
ncbi:serine-rich adhesin for platelets isoform X1 [Eupeodes corollae]|uniref:serine-rich adhesin for platelets isoform X1 n=1 Tax=Eupeodes corollae TaxID=290404 RepID=UPI0024901794|nr:serine-rich adhesin for platelets isoform X1 [Eupeodes corollae]XP_055916174.1 serine-rich adhesin for platelets isoform X1 [Eupeodes corollae]